MDGNRSPQRGAVYCGPVLRHSAGAIQAANFRSAVAFLGPRGDTHQLVLEVLLNAAPAAVSRGCPGDQRAVINR